MDAKAKIEMYDRAKRATDRILFVGSLERDDIIDVVYQVLQEQDISARKRVEEALTRELRCLVDRS